MDRLIRVLGPIDVVEADDVQRIGSSHARALLGALVVSARRAVPVSYLQEVVWGERVPRAADNTLQSYVSHLRSLLGPNAVVNVDHSYLLDVDPDEIDAHRFERLVVGAGETELDAERRRRACRRALRMWRGRPFGEFADHEAFRLEAYRLDELRLTAMEIALTADVDLGHHELVVGELEVLVEESPYREQAWHLLIEALLAGGRRIEAAAACERLRARLDDAGVAPGIALEALEGRVRGRDCA